MGWFRLSLFNNDNIPAAIIDGKDILPGYRQDTPIAGIMFYNSVGDECGGLVYGNKVDENSHYSTSASLTFDQYKQDQVVQMSYTDDNGNRTYGFRLYDRPERNLGKALEEVSKIQNSNLSPEEKEAAIKKEFAGHVQRAFMGKNENGEVSVKLMDSRGKERIRMVVDEEDHPKMEFLDDNGNVIYQLPPKTF